MVGFGGLGEARRGALGSFFFFFFFSVVFSEYSFEDVLNFWCIGRFKDCFFFFFFSEGLGRGVLYFFFLVLIKNMFWRVFGIGVVLLCFLVL